MEKNTVKDVATCRDCRGLNGSVLGLVPIEEVERDITDFVDKDLTKI